MKPLERSDDLRVALSEGLRKRLEPVAARFKLTLAQVVHLAVVQQLPEFEAGRGQGLCPQPVAAESQPGVLQAPPERPGAD